MSCSRRVDENRIEYHARSRFDGREAGKGSQPIGYSGFVLCCSLSVRDSLWCFSVSGGGRQGLSRGVIDELGDLNAIKWVRVRVVVILT